LREAHSKPRRDGRAAAVNAHVAEVLAGMHSLQDRSALSVSGATSSWKAESDSLPPRYEVHVGVEGSFPALSTWVRTLLERHESLALVEVDIRRDSPANPIVRGHVTFHYFGDQ
jgi:hypothetical protein